MLWEPAAHFAPGRLELAVEPPPPCGSFLLQKRDGAFYLALWLKRGAWTQRLSVRPLSYETVTLSLAAAPGQMALYSLDDNGAVEADPSPAACRRP